MRILYGVVGEGMGHATRSRVIIEHLAERSHVIKVVVSGRAHAFLADRLRHLPSVTLEQIEGLTLTYFGNAVDRSASIFDNLKKAPKSIARNIEVYREVAEAGFRPDVVISDFESWAALYARRHGLPVISIDNMQILNRCRHDRRLVRGSEFQFRLARLAVKAKIPGAYHYLVTTFFAPPVRKRYTTLVPPILRPEVRGAERVLGEHVLVYQTQTTNHRLVPLLKKLPYRFRVYGLGREGIDGNVTLCPFSETRFVDDLRSARAVVAGGGFSLMSEAVSLKVPMLSLPVAGQFEQELNARYLSELGFGACGRELDEQLLSRFLDRLNEYSARLSERPPHDESMLFNCLDELLTRITHGKVRPVALHSPALGKWEKD